MRKILLASHGKLAEGMRDSMQMIMGPHPEVEALCAYVRPDVDLDDQIDAVLTRLAPDDELIVVTDLFGGSVNNRWMLRLEDRRIHLLAGMSLSMLVELVNGIESEDVPAMIRSAMDSGHIGMRYCNQIKKVPAAENF